MNPQVLLSLSVFGAVAAGAYAFLTLCDPYWRRVRERVSQIEGSPSAHSSVAHRRSWMTAEAPTRILGELQRLNPYHVAARTRLQLRLSQAGLYAPGSVSRFFMAKLALISLPGALALGAGVLGYLPMNRALLAAAVVTSFGSLVPSFWLDRAIARHRVMLQRALPDFLDLMTVCLEGGMSLQETIRRVSDELRLVHPTFASELGIVQRDIELGATVDQALKRFAVRTAYEGVRTLSTFVREAQRFGTNITDALRSHADMLRSQREQLAEEKAQKAAVKILLPTLLLIFPATFVVIVGPAAIQIHEAFVTK